MENFINKVPLLNYEVGSEHWVDITHINNPHSFYARPTIYRTYLCMLHAYGDKLPLSELKLGSIVIYHSKLLKCNARGRVMFIQNEDTNDVTCDIFALEYGCYEQNIPYTELRKPFRSLEVPALALHCQLADCKPRTDNWSQEVVDSMKFYVAKEQAKMVVRGTCPESVIVELYNSCPEDIATMLAYAGHTTLGYGNNVPSISIEPARHYYRYQQYEVGKTIKVRFQSGDSLKNFFVSKVDDYKVYLKERDEFTNFCRNQDGFNNSDDVKEGMGVGVLMISQNSFERAQVLEVVEKGRVKVILVDWGKTLEVSVGRLRPMVEKYYTRPATAIFCMAQESQVWDNALHKFLYPGYKFNITIVQLGKNHEYPHIIQISPLLDV